MHVARNLLLAFCVFKLNKHELLCNQNKLFVVSVKHNEKNLTALENKLFIASLFNILVCAPLFYII